MRLLATAAIVVLLPGCLSTAKLSKLPKSSAEIDFAQYSKTYHVDREPFWTVKTSNEYYFEKEKIMEEGKLANIIQEALQEKGYSIKQVNYARHYVVGKRGMQANEWGSLTGVYYARSDGSNSIKVYIKTVITQDATGGWSDNRAKRVGVIIEQKIDAAN